MPAAVWSRISSASPPTGPEKIWWTLATWSSSTRRSAVFSSSIGWTRDLRHLEQHAVAGQLRQRRGRAAEPDVQQLDERVLLGLRQFHGDAPFIDLLDHLDDLARRRRLVDEP